MRKPSRQAPHNNFRRRSRADDAPGAADPAFLTVAEAAARWRCSAGKVRAMIAAGDLARLRLGKLIRIPVESVAGFEAQPATPRPPIAPVGISPAGKVALLQARAMKNTDKT